MLLFPLTSRNFTARFKIFLQSRIISQLDFYTIPASLSPEKPVFSVMSLIKFFALINQSLISSKKSSNPNDAKQRFIAIDLQDIPGILYSSYEII